MLAIIRAFAILFLILLPWALYLFMKMKGKQSLRQGDYMEFMRKENYVGQGADARALFIKVVLLLFVDVILCAFSVAIYIHQNEVARYVQQV